MPLTIRCCQSPATCDIISAVGHHSDSCQLRYSNFVQALTCRRSCWTVSTWAVVSLNIHTFHSWRCSMFQNPVIVYRLHRMCFSECYLIGNDSCCWQKRTVSFDACYRPLDTNQTWPYQIRLKIWSLYIASWPRLSKCLLIWTFQLNWIGSATPKFNRRRSEMIAVSLNNIGTHHRYYHHHILESY